MQPVWAIMTWIGAWTPFSKSLGPFGTCARVSLTQVGLHTCGVPQQRGPVEKGCREGGGGAVLAIVIGWGGGLCWQ